MKFRKINYIFAALVITSSQVNAFGVDLCFTSDDKLVNCIAAQDECREQPQDTPAGATACRIAATANSVSGLSGTNTIIGGRSTIHSDATYLMANLIGFSTWQSYQMMMYSEATDQGLYLPFTQTAKRMLTEGEVIECNANWGINMPRHCLAMVQGLSGVYKFNYSTGGMFLHLGARSMSTNSLPPELPYPTDYLSTENKPYEDIIRNFRDWVFGLRLDACAAGITVTKSTPDAPFLPCASSENTLKSPMNFWALGFSMLQLPFVTQLGTFIINEDNTGKTYATDESLSAYIRPHDAAYAKMGMFIHAYEDRYSHHMCTDVSYTFPIGDGNYNSNYNALLCAQGSHFWWHVLEQGTDQSKIEIQHRTMEYALRTIYDELINYANYKGITINAGLDKDQIINNIMSATQIPEPILRSAKMVEIMEDTYHIQPLPGNGSYLNKTIDEWLDDAGVPGGVLKQAKNNSLKKN